MWHDWQRRILRRGSFALAIAGLLTNAASGSTLPKAQQRSDTEAIAPAPEAAKPEPGED